MKIKNSQVDKYGYKLTNIELSDLYESSSCCSYGGAIWKVGKAWFADYKNKDNKHIQLQISNIRGSIFTKSIVKKYLSTKTFIEVLAENIESVHNAGCIDLILTDEEIKELFSLTPSETPEDKEKALKAHEQITTLKKAYLKKQKEKESKNDTINEKYEELKNNLNF